MSGQGAQDKREVCKAWSNIPLASLVGSVSSLL